LLLFVELWETCILKNIYAAISQPKVIKLTLSFRARSLSGSGRSGSRVVKFFDELFRHYLHLLSLDLNICTESFILICFNPIGCKDMHGKLRVGTLKS
jgi:hypothetical protein